MPNGRFPRSAAALAVCGLLSGALGACAHRAAEPDLLAMEPGEAPATAANPAIPKRVSIKSPIAAICAYPGGRAVLDRDLPGLVERPEFDMFKHMSLPMLRAMSHGQMSKADVQRVAADLQRLEGPTTALKPQTLAARS